MWRELRFAARGLRKAPGFTLACVLMLAVGIGATAALVSVVYGILLRPLPYPDPDSLVRFTATERYAGQEHASSFSAVEIPEWSRRVRAFDPLAAYAGQAFGVTDALGTRNVAGAYVSPEFFGTARRPLLLGRGIAPGDDHSAVVVLSGRLWIERLGGDRDVIGKTLVIEGAAHTIIGVAPADFALPSATADLWVPIGRGQDLGVEWLKNPRGGGVNFLARLRPGFTLAQAREDVGAAEHALTGIYPRLADRRVDVVRYSDALTEAVRPTLLVLAAAVVLVLVITCANLVNLQLARHLARSHERAVHVALGASRGRLAGHALAESGVVVTLGSAAALAVASAGVRVLVWMRPAEIPRVDAIRLDTPVLLFTLATAAAIALVVALVPVVGAGSADPVELVQRTGHTHTAGRAAGRFRAGVVAGEVATSVVLLVCAVLLGNSFVRLLHTDLGIKPDHVLTAFVDLDAGQPTAGARASEHEASRVADILRRLSHDPRIESVGAGTSMPPSVARFRLTFTWGPSDAQKMFDAAPISPGLFRTLGIPLIAGRGFSDTDTATSTPVAVLSRAAARDLFGTEDPVGRQLPLDMLVRDHRAEGVTVVGVVGDVHYGGIEAAPKPSLYVPFAQYPFRVVHFFVRTHGSPAAAAPALLDAIRDVDRRMAVIYIRTLEQTVSDAVAQPRFRMVVVAALSFIAVTLAAVGLAGLVAYSISQRTSEIGIRMALGATASDVRQMIVGEASALAIGGIVAGIVLALAAARLLEGMLYGIAPRDPLSFALASVLLLSITLFASYLPARRATRIDPAVALRAE